MKTFLVTMAASVALVLDAAVVVAAADAVITAPIPYTLYDGATDCAPTTQMGSGSVLSVNVIESGSLCETVMESRAGEAAIQTTNKIVVSDCDSTAKATNGYVSVDTVYYACTDETCGDCDEGNPLPYQLILPDYTTGLAVEEYVCWGLVSGESANIASAQKEIAKFEADHSEDVVKYWAIYAENSCMSDTASTSAAPTTASLSSTVATVIAAFAATVAIATLL